jgi:hypothetical protein
VPVVGRWSWQHREADSDDDDDELAAAADAAMAAQGGAPEEDGAQYASDDHGVEHDHGIEDDDEHMEKPISLLQAAADMTRLSRVSQPYTVKSVAWFSLRCTETSSRQFV